MDRMACSGPVEQGLEPPVGRGHGLLVADNAISGAFVPVFLELREEDREREAWRVAGMVLWTTAVLLGALCAVLMLAAPLYVPLLLYGQDNVSSDLVVTLTRILFPIV